MVNERINDKEKTLAMSDLLGTSKFTNSRPAASLTNHARTRASVRGIRESAIEAVLAYGRVVETRGAMIHVIGRKEVMRLQCIGLDLSKLNGLQVVCSPAGAVLTVYRNRDLRGLRSRRKRAWCHRSFLEDRPTAHERLRSLLSAGEA